MSDSWQDDILAVKGSGAVAGQTNVTAASKLKPEAAATALRDGPKVGVPPATAVHNPALVSGMADSRRQATILKTSPHVGSWAAGDPIKVAATQDDFPSLSSIGAKVADWKERADDAINSIGQRKFRIPETGIFNLPDPVKNVLDPALVLKNLTDSVAGTFHAFPREIPKAAPLFTGWDTPRPLAQRWEELKALGGVAGAAANLGIPQFAAFSSVANAAFIQPVASIFDLLPAPPGKTKEEQKQMNREIAATALMGLAPGRRMTFDRPIIDEGNVTPPTNMLPGPREPIMDAEFHPVPGAAPDSTPQFKALADANADHIADVQAAIAESKTLPRSPELMAEYLDEHTPAGQSEVAVPPEAIQKLLDEGHDIFPALRPEIESALATGAEVRMPLSTYLAETAGKPYAAALLDVTRFNELAVSKEEAKNLPEPVEEDLLPAKEEIEGKPGVNVRRMANMLGPQLYGDPEATAAVTAKEVLQNSFDAIKSAMQDKGLLKGKIDVELDRNERKIIFKDNGAGMAPDLLGGKFLQIAGSEKGENASGGFGIAKMLFLYGNNELHVQTLKDGVYSEMKTSGPELMNALEDDTARPKIQTNKVDKLWGDQRAEIEALFPDGHGTRISIQIPETYLDTKTGEQKPIPYPYGESDLPALGKSPLFADVDVSFKNYYDYEPKPLDEIGSRFPAKDYTTFGNVKFPWGTARIYISKEPLEHPSYGGEVHILSNGLWQFTEKLPKDPTNPYGGSLPYRIFLDIAPHVKPDQAGYPFGFNRQAFTETAKADLAEVKKYIQATYGAKLLAAGAEDFHTVTYLDKRGYSSPVELKPEVPQTKNAFDMLAEDDQVEVKDGKLIINGKEIPSLTPEELSANLPKSDELKIDQNLIDPQRVMIHDNTVVEVEGTEDDPFPDERSFGTEMLIKYGQDWKNFEHLTGSRFIELRNEVARVMNYPKLETEAIGISYDKTYRGVSIKVPFSGMFINPVAAEGATPMQQAYGIVGTMIHELAHFKVRSHNASFPAEMQRILYTLQADEAFDFMGWQQDLAQNLVADFTKIMTEGKELFNGSSVKNRASSFTDASSESAGDGGDEGVSGELAPARQGREGTGGVPEGIGSGPEGGERGGPLPGVPEPGSQGIGGNAGADKVGSFVEDITQATTVLQKGIAQVEAELGLRRILTDAKAAGMTAKQFAGYDAALREWEQATTDKLVKKMVKQFHKEHGPDWKAAVALQKEEALNLIENLPHVQAYRLLTESGYQLDRQVVADNYPGLVLPKKLTAVNGLNPDEAAELTGFETGGQLVKALADLEQAVVASGAKSLDGYVKLRADVFAQEQARVMTGYDMSPEAIMQHVMEELDSPVLENLMIDQLKSYAEEKGLPFDQKAMKALSEKEFGKLKVKDALRTQAFASNFRRLGNKTEEGLQGGKVDKAFVMKQQQFLQFDFIKQSLALQKDYAKTQRKFTRWAKTPASRNIEQTYMNYVHAELKVMGYNVKRDTAELVEQLGGITLHDFILNKEAQGEVIFFEPFPEQDPKLMSVDDYRNARDTLSSLVHNGRREAGVVIMGKRTAMKDLLDRVKAKGEELGNKLTPEKLENRHVVHQGLSAANAYMLKGEQILDEVDVNDPKGPLNQSVVYPLQEAKGRENDMLQNVTKQLKEFGKAQPSNWLGTMKVKIDVPELLYTNPLTGLQERVVTTRGKLTKLMLNLGNEVNLTKLLEGFGWDYGDVMTVVHKHATKADWDFVQKVWDLHEELWPEIARVYRNLAGVAPKRRVAAPIQTPFGVYDGGYFPIQYDKLRSPDVRTMSADSIWGAEWSSGLPSNPYTKGVTAYVAPLDLTFEGLNKSIGQVIHDLAFREALSQSVRVLGSDTVRKVVQANLGPSYTAQLRPWLEYIARQRVFDDKSAGFLENFFAGARSNITFVGLAYRRTSALIHGSVAFSDSIAEVGAKDFGHAVMDMLASPGQAKYWDDFITTNSPEIRHRAMNMDQNIREAFLHLAEKQGFLDEVQKYGYHMLAFSDNISAKPTWLAAYRQELARGSSPEEAFMVADKRVRQAHGASHPVDIAAVQRGGQGVWAEAGKSTFGLFLSFMNHTYNRLFSIGRKFGRGFSNAKAGDWAGAQRDWSRATAMTFGYTILAAMSVTALKTWFHTGSPIPKHWEDWVDGIAHTTFGGLPGVATLLDAIEGKERESPLERAITTNVATAHNAWNKITGHESKVSKRWLQQGMEATGYWTGKVPGALAKDTQYIYDVATGAERPPKDLNEFMQVLVTGGRVKKGSH